MRNFKSHSLSNFQVLQCSIINKHYHAVVTSHDLFYSWKSVPFDLLQLILPSPSSPASGNHQSVLYAFCFVLFFRLHICDIIQYLSFSVRLILLGTVPLKSIHTATNVKISFFFNS